MVGEWVFWALLSAAFAAATAVLAKAGTDNVDPDFANLLRTGVILVCMVLLVTATGKWRATDGLTSRAALFLALSAVATGASWMCYFRALKVGDASKVGPVDKLSVVLVAVFAVVFLRERLNLREWTGVGLITVGVVLLALKR
jgi:bacterial/archaeal transporter family protein